MKDKIILHVDANNFYASVECAIHPKYKNKALAVSGNPKKRSGIILAKNQVAKTMGVTTGEAIWQAKEKCPELICLLPDFHRYEEYSKKLKKIYKKYTHLIEPMGLDECWLDITETAHLFGTPEEIATAIRKEVRQTLGITVSVGISFCKLFAKLGSDLKKPDAQTVISRENYQKLVYPMPIESIIGIGHRMKKNLNKLNVFTLGDLLDVPGYILKTKFSVVFYELRKKLLGFDSDNIASCYSNTPPKSVGNGTTTIIDIFYEEDVEATVLFLADKISSRLRNQNLFANCISVSIRNCRFKTKHCMKVLPFATNSTADIVKFSMEIIRSFWSFGEKIRSIRVSTRNLTEGNVTQLSIFQKCEDKKTALNIALDQIREKYGKNSIQPATILATSFVRENFTM